MVGQTGGSEHFGKPELDAYTLAIEEWNAKGGLNGKNIKLRVEDTQTSQKQIISGFNRLALENPAVILGPTWLDSYQGVVPLAKRKDILLVTPSAAHETFMASNITWPITFYHNSTIEAKELVKGLKEKGFKKIGIIYEEEPFAEMFRKLVVKDLPEPAVMIGVQGGEVEFSTILAKIREQKTDALIILLWEERSLLSFLQKLRVQLPGLPIATIHDAEGWLEKPEFRTAVQRIIFSKFVVADPSFTERFKERFGYPPLITASNAYDAMNAVLEAYKAGKNSAEEIRSFLLNHKFNTATFGKFKFHADGSVPSTIEIVDFKNDKALS